MCGGGKEGGSTIDKGYPGHNLILIAIASIFISGYLIANPPDGVTSLRGEGTFEEKCVPCHTIGGGDRIGPDLKGITRRRDRDWLIAFISSPEKMFSDKDPLALELLERFNGIRMPNPGLTDGEVNNLISYLSEEGISQPEGGISPAPAGEAGKEEAGDPTSGMKLFSGSISFKGGGAPCIGCHGISGLTALGGGTLGPDLTESYDDYGDEGLSSVLTEIPFPAMKPIYEKHPLSREEQANLVAFMEKAALNEQLTGQTVRFGMLAGGIFIVLMILVQVAWRGRLRDVRKNLVDGD